MRSKITVVFELENGQLPAELYEAHKTGRPFHGLRPTTIARGDQVNVPSQILEGLTELSSDFHNKEALAELFAMAKDHLFEEARETMQRALASHG